MLKTIQLTKTFSRQNRSFEAVDHVSFSLEAGEMAVLTGPSGCGKSTLFHLLCGITRPDSGQIFFEDSEVTGLSNREFAALRAEKISYVLQGDSLLPNLTVLENIYLPHELYAPAREFKEEAMALLERFGLGCLAEDLPANLSGGERRRVAIARAVVHGPKLVVADEPTSDLDEENATMIMDFFQAQAAEGRAVLISTHDHSIIRPGSTHYAMKHGRMTHI